MKAEIFRVVDRENFYFVAQFSTKSIEAGIAEAKRRFPYTTNNTNYQLIFT